MQTFSASHLLQMRGLKLSDINSNTAVKAVASFTDAWIETCFHAADDHDKGRIFYRCVD